MPKEKIKEAVEFFTLDKESCTSCGACTSECPIQIIKMDSGMPSIVEGGEKACINCGHCVTVCPTEAISLGAMPVGECEELRQLWRIPPEKMSQFLKGRRSIRTYDGRSVDKAQIERLIDIARYAPSGINRQPVNWAVIYDPENVKKLSGLVVEWMRSMVSEKSPIAESLRLERIVKAWDEGRDLVSRGAPHLIISYGLKDDPIAPQACTIALTYLELAALSMDMGTCWAGYVSMAVNMSAEVRKAAGLSSKASSFGAMMLGYPKFEYYSIPVRNKPHIIWR